MTHNLSAELAELRQELTELKGEVQHWREQFDAMNGVLHDLGGYLAIRETLEKYQRETVGTEG